MITPISPHSLKRKFVLDSLKKNFELINLYEICNNAIFNAFIYLNSYRSLQFRKRMQ